MQVFPKWRLLYRQTKFYMHFAFHLILKQYIARTMYS